MLEIDILDSTTKKKLTWDVANKTMPKIENDYEILDVRAGRNLIGVSYVYHRLTDYKKISNLLSQGVDLSLLSAIAIASITDLKTACSIYESGNFVAVKTHQNMSSFSKALIKKGLSKIKVEHVDAVYPYFNHERHGLHVYENEEYVYHEGYFVKLN